MPERLLLLYQSILVMLHEYWVSALLGVSSFTLATLWQFLPEPETAGKALVLAFGTGIVGGLGKWTVEVIKRLVTKWINRKHYGK